jgi:hypothetical protein
VARTLLQIVQTITNQLSLNQPTVVIGSTDPQILQILSLLNQAGQEIQQDHDWTALQTLWVVSISAPVTTTGNLTLSSAVIAAIPTTAAISASYFVCSGTGIPVAARVSSVDSSTQVTLDMKATVASTGATLVFAQDTYAEPTDFDRFINDTAWDRTNQWRLIGPDSPQIDQWHRSGIVTTGPRRHFRQIGQSPTNYRLWPPPTATDTPFQIAWEYISKNWVVSSGGVMGSTFTADTDVPVFDDNMLILGGKWRFLQAKGFEYGPQQMEAMDYQDRRRAMDGGAGKLSLSPRGSNIFLSPANIQDGNWPGGTGPNMS